jgi:ribosome biogenesis GTPase / thiamine phosphate phosphatase
VLPDGGLLVDSPGMRELTLADVEQGAAELFADLADLAATCRFANCRHETEPGCAVQAALAGGTLDPRRLESYRKLKLGQDEAVRPEPALPRNRVPRGRAKRKR